MRVKVDYRIASKECYNKFCKNHPEIKIDFDTWADVIYTFTYMFRDYILETGEAVKLPGGFGPHSIQKKKMIKTRTVDGKEIIIMPVDWKKTRERGKKIYHMNFHTDGYRFKWRWFVKQARFKFSKYWVFKPSRVTSRKIAEYVLKPNSDYRHIYREWHLM